MSLRLSRRRLLQWLGAAAMGTSSIGCGTIMYPERRGQPAGRLDWKVIALDGALLILFIVPGVIAFAVDFATGAIYLPPYMSYHARRPDPQHEFAQLHVPRSQLNQAGIEQAVSQHTQRDVKLEPGQYQSQQLSSLGDFWDAHDALAPPDENPLR